MPISNLLRPISRAPHRVVAALLALYLLAILLANRGELQVFVTLGTCFSGCGGFAGSCPAGTTEGYDGQFAYYIARDPAASPSCLDEPAYRYQRILLPIAGRVLAFGQAALIPLAFLLINGAALVGATYLLEQLLTAFKVSHWYALVYGLFVGLFMSVRLSTTEPLAYGLVVLALWAQHKTGGIYPAPTKREGLWVWLEPIAFLLAVLAKEMALVFAIGAGLHALYHRDWKRALRLIFVVALPTVLWQLYLYQGFGAIGFGSGGAGGGGKSGFEIIPFNGLWRVAYDPTGGLRPFMVIAAYALPFIVLPSLLSGWLIVRDLWRGKRDLSIWLLLLNVIVMWTLPFSTYREPLGMLRVMVGLVLAYLLYAAQHHPRSRLLRYAGLWLILGVYLLAG